MRDSRRGAGAAEGLASRAAGWVALLALLGAPVLADAFAQGNAAYERGDFGAARANYERALGELGARPAVLYNLGNACFRQGELGQAIVYWRRAARVAPRDQEVRANLEYAAELSADRFEAPPQPFWARILGTVPGRLTEGESWVVCLAAYWLAAAALLVALKTGGERRRRVLYRGATGLALVALLAAVVLAVQVHRETGRPEAVVLAPEVDVRSAPGGSFPVTFTLHEGTVVRVDRERGVWRHVVLPSGLEGWLREGQMESI